MLVKMGMISPNRGENKKYLKPPPRSILRDFGGFQMFLSTKVLVLLKSPLDAPPLETLFCTPYRTWKMLKCAEMRRCLKIGFWVFWAKSSKNMGKRMKNQKTIENTQHPKETKLDRFPRRLRGFRSSHHNVLQPKEPNFFLRKKRKVATDPTKRMKHRDSAYDFCLH